MTTDLFKCTIFNNGEGLTFQDAIDAQAYLLAKLFDEIIAQSGGAWSFTTGKDPQFGGQNGFDLPTYRCYSLDPGTAYLRQGSANNKIQIAPGVLLQKIANATGNAATLLAYAFDGTSTNEFTLTNGDATNPRIDLLQMTLAYLDGDLQSRNFEDATTRVITTTSFNKKRFVSCTLSVKAGTPGASPVIPEPDAGVVPVGMVMVGNGWTTAGTAPIFGVDTAALNNLVVMDLRCPIRKIAGYRVWPQSFLIGTNWTIVNGDHAIVAGASNDIFIPCPQVGIGRLLAVGVCHNDATSTLGTGFLGQSTGFVTGTFLNRNNLATLSVAAVTHEDITPYYVWEGAHNPAAGPTIQQSVTTKIGVPLWTNGRRCPFEKVRLVAAGAVPTDTLALTYHNQSSAPSVNLGAVTFYIAE